MKKLSVIEMISISYEWGGIEQHVYDVSAGLVSRGHNVRVVCRDVEMYKQTYGQVCQVHVLPIRSAIDFVTVRGLAKLITEHAVDVIHTHTSRDSWLALFASWLAGRGKVVTTRHVPLLAKQDMIHTWYYNKLAGIICVSQFVRNKFLGDKPKINTENIKVIYPGIKIEQTSNIVPRIIRDKLGISDETFLIGFVGRITVEKGLNDLLKAAALLKQQGRDFRMILVGAVNPKTPEYLEQLKGQAIELNIDSNIFFFGFTKDVPSVMKDIDVLVLPSIIPETFGLVLCEAMLAEKPVITTDLGAQGEIVKDNFSGLIFKAGIPADLAEKIDYVYENRNKLNQLGNDGKKSIKDKFSHPKMIYNIESFLCNIAE